MKKQIISFNEFKERKSEELNSSNSQQKSSFFTRKKNKNQKEVKRKFPSFFWLGERLKIEGFNQTRLLNDFLAAGVKTYELDKNSASVMFAAIANKDLVKAFAILDKLGYTYEVVKRVSPKSVGQFFLSKIALCVAVAVAFVVGAYAYGYVWRVEVTGYERVDPLWVERNIAEAGFGRGVRKSQHDIHQLAAFINSLDNLLEATVEIVGTTLRIDIVENTIYFQNPPGSLNGIFSDFDAIVTRIEATNGTPVVDIGTRVFAGATLIGAHHVDTQGNIHPAVARGRVYGQVTFTDSVRFSTITNVREPTGEVKKANRVSMFGIPFRPVVSPFVSPSGGGDIVTTYSYPFENFFIPLKLQRTVITEMHWVRRELILEDKVLELKQAALLDRLPQIGGAEFSQNYILEEVGLNANGDPEFILHSFISAELLIGIP